MTAGGKSGLLLSALRSKLIGPFDLAFATGSITTISGASGSGKSLFLRMVADLDPNEGEVTLDNIARSAMRGPEWRRQTPYVAAESSWWGTAVGDHFAPEHQNAARCLAERLGVGGAQLAGPVARLSTGERQRLALVRALVLGSPVLLLDEPTGPLDPDSVARVEAVLVERAATGTVILMVSHDPAQGTRLGAQRLRMIHQHLEPVA